ncbi:MAG: hypothetical protein H7176_05965 [Bdellovibrionales bacterium]|nr:hypothetical protein [Massilia sp.]
MNYSTRGAGLGLALMLYASCSPAQEVRVFSEGRQIAVADEAANELRGRPRDERKARKALAERADATAIAAAHAAAFLHCGLNESKFPPEKASTPEELNYFVKDATYIPIAGTHKIILLGEYSRGKAIVDLDKHSIQTPQCPAGVRTMFWSFSTDRVVFATQEVSKIDFHGASRAFWTAKFNPAQDVFYFDAAHPAAGFHKLLTLPDEKVLDMLLPDKADYVWVLSEAERMDLGDPRKWLRAAAGAPASKMDITLRKVDLHGAVLERVEIARAVPAGTAHFVRE